VGRQAVALDSTAAWHYLSDLSAGWFLFIVFDI
jgi:hypothetical protein